MSEPGVLEETHLTFRLAPDMELQVRACACEVAKSIRMGRDKVEEVGMADGFADAGEHLGYIHLSESNRGVPGRGTMDWPGTFEGLKAVGYDGAMTLESFVHLPPEIASGLAIWRPVADRPEDVVEAGLPFIRDSAGKAGMALAS